MSTYPARPQTFSQLIAVGDQQSLTVSIPAAAARVLAALIQDQGAVQRAAQLAASMEAPTASDLSQSLASLSDGSTDELSESERETAQAFARMPGASRQVLESGLETVIDSVVQRRGVSRAHARQDVMRFCRQQSRS